MTYYWVLGYSDDGKRAVLGPYTSEAKAEEACDYLVEPTVYPLETKNQQKAVKIIKAILMEQGKDADDALERQLHDKGLRKRGINIPKALALGGEDVFKGNPFKED